MLSILSRLLWFVLAGFILGFATSTIWEWYYYRGKRLATGNRRVLELETELQRKDELIAELHRAIDSNGQGLAAETSTPQTRWNQDRDDEEPSFTRTTERWSTASALSATPTDTEIDTEVVSRNDSQSVPHTRRRVSDILPADVPSSEQTAKVRQFTRDLEELTAGAHTTAQRSPAANTRDNLETRIPPRPQQAPSSARPDKTEPTVEVRAEENNEPLITFRRGPARPHYSEVMLRPEQTSSSSARAEPDRAEPSQPVDNHVQARRFPTETSAAQTATEPFDEEDAPDLATNESAYSGSDVETEARPPQSASVAVEEQPESKDVESSVDRKKVASSDTEETSAPQISEHPTSQAPAPEPAQRPTVRAKSSRNPSKAQSRPPAQPAAESESDAQSESVAPSVIETDDHAQVGKKVSNHPDDFTQIDGIGPALCRNLYGSGIYTWHQLSQTDKEELSPVTKDDKKINGWKRQARELAQKNQRTEATYNGKTPSVFKEIRALKPGDPQVLYSGGITTFEELAACNPETLKALFQDIAGGNTKNFTNWIERARELQS